MNDYFNRWRLFWMCKTRRSDPRPRSKRPNRWRLLWWLPGRRRLWSTPLTKLQWRKHARNHANRRLWLPHKQWLEKRRPQP